MALQTFSSAFGAGSTNTVGFLSQTHTVLIGSVDNNGRIIGENSSARCRLPNVLAGRPYLRLSVEAMTDRKIKVGGDVGVTFVHAIQEIGAVS